jgi:hypothetical protein
MIRQRLAELEKVTPAQWEQLREEDPVHVQRLRDELSDLRAAEGRWLQHLQIKHEARSRKAAEQAAAIAEHSARALERLIPNWSPKLADDLSAFGASHYKIPVADVEEAMRTNPIAIQVLHDAYIGRQLREQQRREALPASPPAQPVRHVASGKSAPSSLPSDKDDVETWAAKERARMRRMQANR